MDRLLEALQQLVNGVSLGSIYALIALGYTMVYGVLRFINFAHGDIYMLGAYSGYLLAPLFAHFFKFGEFDIHTFGSRLDYDSVDGDLRGDRSLN
jgi:branched-subunit amino acid ABC-type transport system permease component